MQSLRVQLLKVNINSATLTLQKELTDLDHQVIIKETVCDSDDIISNPYSTGNQLLSRFG